MKSYDRSRDLYERAKGVADSVGVEGTTILLTSLRTPPFDLGRWRTVARTIPSRARI